MHNRSLTALTVVAALLVPAATGAHLVTGKVKGGGYKADRDTLFIFKADSAVAVDTVRASDSRDFARVLAPGRYRVEFRDKHGVLWTADLVAEEEPVRVSIQLHKADRP